MHRSRSNTRIRVESSGAAKSPTGSEVSGSGVPNSCLDRPRERLFRLGVELLTDRELLALVLRTGSQEASALKLSDSLLSVCGGFKALASVSHSELISFPGIGPAKSASLVASVEMGRRLVARPLKRGDRINSARDVFDHFRQSIGFRRQEYFMVLLLDGRNRVLSESRVSQGTLTASLVHPREVFRRAVRSSAASIVLAHNHPSGDAAPSAEDLRVTQRLVEAGEIVGIRIVDHVVVAEHDFYSFQEHGQMAQ